MSSTFIKPTKKNFRNRFSYTNIKMRGDLYSLFNTDRLESAVELYTLNTDSMELELNAFVDWRTNNEHWTMVNIALYTIRNTTIHNTHSSNILHLHFNKMFDWAIQWNNVATSRRKTSVGKVWTAANESTPTSRYSAPTVRMYNAFTHIYIYLFSYLSITYLQKNEIWMH